MRFKFLLPRSGPWDIVCFVMKPGNKSVGPSGAWDSSGRERAPYQDLYIYMVEGALDETQASGLGDDFIGNWVEGDSSFLFFSAPSTDSVTSLLGRVMGHRLTDEFHFTYAQWQGGGLRPLRIPPFLIVPPWVRETEKTEEIRILLDPGVVFGNGLHPTTRHCLEALVRAREKSPLGRVLDLGTGTGILALGAAALGAKNVHALDLNPLCVRTARRNVQLNGFEEKIRVTEGRAEDAFSLVSDLTLANIHHEVALGFLEGRSFRAGERIVISGQMRSQVRDLEGRLRGGGFRVLEEWDHEMTWYTVLAEKRQVGPRQEIQ